MGKKDLLGIYTILNSIEILNIGMVIFKVKNGLLKIDLNQEKIYMVVGSVTLVKKNSMNSELKYHDYLLLYREILKRNISVLIISNI